jgi:cytochrome c oxidase subunit 3
MSTTVAAAHPEAHAEHPPHLQHHFVSSDQQFDAAKMGMWLFLVTEILLFAGMFVAYTVYRVWHPEVFAVASVALNPWLGGLNTLVLLASSFTVALSIHHIQKGNQKGLLINLLLTLAAGCVFLIVKYFEYTHKFHLGIFPGENFAYAEMDIPYVPQFFSIYFVMTGIHGVHVAVGIGIFAWLSYRAYRGHFSSEWYTPVELSGLYWHLVDIIWIFLFPLLYLI